MNEIWQGLDWSVMTTMLARVLPALVCITLHELAHGFVAYRLGDPTAKEAGRLTLNPIRHIDIMGLLCMVMFGFGWAKPVPVNMGRFQHPRRGMALTALAGPVTNLLIALVVAFLFGFFAVPISQSGAVDFFVEVFIQTVYLSVALAIFNILPIPPLDGSKVLFSLLSDAAYMRLMHIERYGMIILFGILAVLNRIDANPLWAAADFVFDEFMVLANWGVALYAMIF